MRVANARDQKTKNKFLYFEKVRREKEVTGSKFRWRSKASVSLLTKFHKSTIALYYSHANRLRRIFAPGINVGGNKIVKMDTLRETFEALDLKCADVACEWNVILKRRK